MRRGEVTGVTGQSERVVHAPDPPVTGVPAQAAPVEDRTVRLTAPATGVGSVLAERYRLRVRIGADLAAGAEFWRAEDVVLQRDVAITLLRRPAADTTRDSAQRAEEMITRALRSGCFEHPGCARLLDVLSPATAAIPPEVLGVAVTEWVPGRSLAEVVADGLLRPLAAARAIQPLAAAAEAAHRHGLVLGCDHPQRIRVTPDGRAQLAFALARPDVGADDDVRGLGAVLYALLTSRWPLSGSDAAHAGLAAAVRTPGGALEPPSALRLGVPVELDALTGGTVGPLDAPARVHTAAAVRRLVDEVVAEDDRLALFPPARDGVPSAPGDVWQDRVSRRPVADPDRRRKLLLGIAGLGAAALVALGYVGVQVGALFADPDGPTIVVDGTDRPVASGPATGGPVRVAGVEVFDETGDRDNAGRVSRVIDGDPASSWRTFVYRQQFPALKPGVGIMVSFASPVQLASLTVTSPSPGTRLEIRSAPAADSGFADTVPVAATTLADGRTEVSLAQSQPVEHVLLWITELGGGGSENVTQIDEVEFVRAGA